MLTLSIGANRQAGALDTDNHAGPPKQVAFVRAGAAAVLELSGGAPPLVTAVIAQPAAVPVSVTVETGAGAVLELVGGGAPVVTASDGGGADEPVTAVLAQADVSGWRTRGPVALSGAQAADPAGETTLATIAATGASTPQIQHKTNVDLGAAGQYWVGMVVKPMTAPWCYFDWGQTSVGTLRAWFNPSTGTTGEVTGNVEDRLVIDLGGGLFTLAMRFSENGSDLVGRMRFGLSDADRSMVSADGHSLHAGWFHIVNAASNGGYPGHPFEGDAT